MYSVYYTTLRIIEAMSSIIQQLENNGYTVIEFAKKHNVTRGAVYQSINGLGSRELRVKIAKTINKSPAELWGESYKLDVALFLVGDL